MTTQERDAGIKMHLLEAAKIYLEHSSSLPGADEWSDMTRWDNLSQEQKEDLVRILFGWQINPLKQGGDQ